MRALPLWVGTTFLLIAFAGCLDSDSGTDSVDLAGGVGTSGGSSVNTTTSATVSTNESDVSEGRPDFEFPEDYPVFCDENKTGAGAFGREPCTFYDEIFHGYTLYDVDTPKLDVIIVPPASPEAARDIVTLRMAVEAWRDGVQELGQPWFTEVFQMNVYVAGEDTIPADAIEDPEIIVLAAEFNPILLFGIGLEPSQFLYGENSPCRSGDEANRVYEVHSHDGMRIQAAECEDGGFTCAAINTNFAFPTGDAHSMYDLVAHEVGHCMGPGHVGDALDFFAKRVPIADIMSYTAIEDQVHCVSNLNVRVIEGIYGDMIASRPSDVVLLGADDFVHMHPADYYNVECENPPTGILS